jgi:hypothetical protein
MFGGIGALMPVLVTVVTLDLAALFAKDDVITRANVIGIVIRYVLLFLIGGFVAYLHKEEESDFKLFELDQSLHSPSRRASVCRQRPRPCSRWNVRSPMSGR